MADSCIYEIMNAFFIIVSDYLNIFLFEIVLVLQVYASMSPIVHLVNVGSGTTKESHANVTVRSPSIIKFWYSKSSNLT